MILLLDYVLTTFSISADTPITPRPSGLTSTSLDRAPAPTKSFVRGKSGYVPFWPGGLDDPIVETFEWNRAWIQDKRSEDCTAWVLVVVCIFQGRKKTDDDDLLAS